MEAVLLRLSSSPAPPPALARWWALAEEAAPSLPLPKGVRRWLRWWVAVLSVTREVALSRVVVPTRVRVLTVSRTSEAVVVPGPSPSRQARRWRSGRAAVPSAAWGPAAVPR